MKKLPYLDRAQAGRALAMHLYHLAGRDDVLVLALPRGGVPVAAVVAEALDAPLDVLTVRKLGVPGQPELAMGAVAANMEPFLNRPVIEAAAIADTELAQVIERERAEVRRRERAYRGRRPPPEWTDRTVVVVDDGLATGSTMLAALRTVRRGHPTRVIAAVPVAPPESVQALRGKLDQFVCPATPATFQSVGRWYVDFRQVSDDEVRRHLVRAWAREPSSVT